MSVLHLPRLLVAAPASGHGKTTVTTGLMAALRAAGDVVSPHKVGPDYIDPGFHALACGRVGRNLDPWLCGAELIGPLLAHGALTPTPATIAIIEGVMGLFDGRLGTNGEGSAAHVAALTSTPVVLVVDTSHTSRSIGALVHGMATYDPRITLGGVILNKVASPRHEAEVRAALEPVGLPVLGCLRRDADIEQPSRHLGLVPAEESAASEALVAALAARIAEAVDLEAVRALAASAEDLDVEAWDPAAHVHPSSPARPVVAIAGGRAFTFRYAETAELLTAAGCEPVVVDPLSDVALPPGTAGLYLGGGFPEVHATELAANTAFTGAVRDAVAAGMPTVAECAGLLYLGSDVDGVAMTGALPHRAAMAPRLAMGYRDAVAPADTLLARAGDHVHGHEFHRTRVSGLDAPPAWAWDEVHDGLSLDPAGTGNPTVHASYLHLHWAGHPQVAQRFADAVHTFAARRPAAVATAEPRRPVRVEPVPEPDLTHHGDRDAVPGALDLAVNVSVLGPPPWLADALAAVDVTRYPDARPARDALAAHHGLAPAQVLPTAGAAEAFTLLARAWAHRSWCIVHPQFTEPEAALRTAGARVHRHVLRPENGFSLDVDALVADCRAHGCDVVVIGNPTNPTGVRHDVADLTAILAAGLGLVVDEAFLDACPEASLLCHDGDVVVLRSLTKIWAVPGVRAGWLFGPADAVTAFAAQQPPWSVSAHALAAMLATSTSQAGAKARARVAAVGPARTDLIARLEALGLAVVPGSQAPFVLVDTGLPHSPRAALADLGVAVRRGESFPGLGPSWIRLAVRDPEAHQRLVDALSRVIEKKERP